MDKNSIIGFFLIFIILMTYSYYTSPTEAELAEQARIEDSLRIEKNRLDSLELVNQNQSLESQINDTEVSSPASDSMAVISAMSIYGSFATASVGTEENHHIGNNVFDIKISNKGGKIKSVHLLDFKKVVVDSAKNETKQPLYLMDDAKDQFHFVLRSKESGKIIKTDDLFFELVEKSREKIVLRAKAGNGYIEQTYEVAPDTYNIDYGVKMVNLDNILDLSDEGVKLRWDVFLDKIEKNVDFEKTYSTVYFREHQDDVDYCSCRGDDDEDADYPVQWVSNSNQFFNASLITTDRPFIKGKFATRAVDEDSNDLKKLQTELYVPMEDGSAIMKMYVGPNEFQRLRNYGVSLEDIIPFGSSIFGTINRWIIRPLFNFLSSFIGSAGIVILMLTLIVKLVLYPLTYRMIRSQAKMSLLKPHMNKLKEKFKDDPTQQQAATMKLYSEFGVSPLGGCLPMVLQMPVWFALYRFFPAAIDFRQESFLWAPDLSSFDAAISIPELPLLGSHLSLFTLLWAIVTIFYSWYNSRLVDVSQANPSLKYIQYFMPITFIFFFNTYASGLTCYLFFSSLFNLAQTVITKNYLINDSKLQGELDASKATPKKQSKFSKRLQEAMTEQKKKADQAQKNQAKRKKR